MQASARPCSARRSPPGSPDRARRLPLVARPLGRASAAAPAALAARMALAAFVALCTSGLGPAPCGVAAAGESGSELRIDEAAFEARGRDVLVLIKGGAALPERARLTATLLYQGKQAREVYASGYVERGAFAIEIGPLERTPLPGRYVALVSFNLAEQHPAVRKAWAAATAGLGLRPDRLMRSKELTYGDPAAEKAERERAQAAYRVTADRMEAAAKDFETGWRAREKKERFMKAGHLDAAAWEEFADGHLRTWAELEKERVELENLTLVPLFPTVHDRMTSFLYIFRNVVLALTRDLLRAEKLAIPEKYEQPSRMEDLFREIGKLGQAAAALAEARVVLAKGTEDAPVVIGQSNKSAAEEAQEIGVWATGWVAKLEAARAELAQRAAAAGPAAGAAGAAGAGGGGGGGETAEAAGKRFDAAVWEAWHGGWQAGVEKLRLERKVLKLDTAMDAEGLIGLKYPAVYGYTDQLVTDLGELGSAEAGLAYRRAGKAVPKKYLAEGAEAPAAGDAGEALTLEEAAAERDRVKAVYDARLEQVAGVLGVALPPAGGGAAPTDGGAGGK
ncbi:MAG: hypothetical protein HZA54_03000 [Planctomycetes bacterium]|nr:hypothetical protein [Planctomycetota bacterium]